MIFSSKLQQIYIEKRIFSSKYFFSTVERKSDIRNDMVKAVYLRYFETKSKQQWIPLAFIVSIFFFFFFFFFVFLKRQ